MELLGLPRLRVRRYLVEVYQKGAELVPPRCGGCNPGHIRGGGGGVPPGAVPGGGRGVGLAGRDDHWGGL